jgi:hypothetical protein
MQNKCFLSRINELFSWVLINALTEHVGTSTHLYGNPTNRERTCRGRLPG